MLVIKNVSKKFNSLTVLKNINITFPNKGLFFIVGESGSGKTTLMNIIARLDKEDVGEVWYNNTNLTLSKDNKISAYRHSIVGMVFQNYNLIQDLSVEENFDLVNGLNSKRKQRFLYYLNSFKAISLLKAYPYEMSGGEQQRVALARSLSFNYKIILADEPTGSLDTENASYVMQALIDASKASLVLIVTHDSMLIQVKNARIIKISNGEIIHKDKAVKYVEAYSFQGKRINILNILKNSFRSFQNRIGQYSVLGVTVSLILGFLIINLSLYNGIIKYIDLQSETKLDSNSFSIYSVENGEFKNFDPKILGILETHTSKIDLNSLFNNYFNQIIKLPKDEYFEVKITNLSDTLNVNNLFYELMNNNEIEMSGDILIPFFKDNKTSYEKISIEKEVIKAQIIHENRIYNVPKVYIPEEYVFEILGKLKLPLISKQLRLDDINFLEYHKDYQEYLGLNGYLFVFESFNERKIVSDSLIERSDVFTFYERPNQDKYYQIRLNDEMFELTFKELVESGRLIVTLLVLTLVFTLINVGSLILNFTFRKRTFEYSIMKVYGSTNLEIILSILSELFILILFSLSILFLLIFTTKTIINTILGGSFDFIPLNLNSFVISISLTLLVYGLGSFETIVKSTKMNLIESLRND